MSDENLQELQGLVGDLCQRIAHLPLSEKIAFLNYLRRAVREVSPFAAEPIENVQWIAVEHIRTTEHNPNTMGPSEVRLLRHSISTDGYTQPLLGHSMGQEVGLIDGNHRLRVCQKSRTLRKRLMGHLPVVIVNPTGEALASRMGTAVRHNRARGVLYVEKMQEIIAYLLAGGNSDDIVMQSLGMDFDELLRYKQITGLPGLFKEAGYSIAWE